LASEKSSENIGEKMTLEMYEFGKSLGIRGAKKNIGSILTKASYPLTGNLSALVRDRMENYLGGEIFKSTPAAVLSFFTNSLLYSGAIAGLSPNYLDGSLRKCFSVGLILAALESFIRVGLSDEKRKRISASLLGKLVSLPIEAGIGIYDGIKSRRSTGEK